MTNIPAHIIPGPFPTSQGGLFDFIFSNPFRKDSPIIQAGPKHSEGHFLPGPISTNKPIFVDGKTGELFETMR